METRIFHSRLNEACLLLALVMATSTQAHTQSLPTGGQTHPPLRITQWKEDLPGAVHFMHELFPDINPMSKSIILNNLDWKSSPAGTSAFTIYICEPDSANRDEEVRKRLLTRYDIQCAALTMRATFFMTGSPLGPVPRGIMIGRPDIDERWNETAALLISHPEWSDVQIENAITAAGVKYGRGSRSEVVAPIYKILNQLEPFFGRLVIDSIDYTGPILSDKSQPGPPAWVVKAHPSGQDKTKSWIRYVLAFSAFTGALESETTFEELGSSEPSKTQR
jgi:hypothetical protein